MLITNKFMPNFPSRVFKAPPLEINLTFGLATFMPFFMNFVKNFFNLNPKTTLFRFWIIQLFLRI